MDLHTHYAKLYQDSISKISADDYEIDQLINDPKDDRRGLTLFTRPDENVKLKIASLLDELRVIEPAQYYHPLEDLHTTILAIISCFNGFDLAQIDPIAYQEKITDALVGIEPFQIKYHGITASPSCILIQGFPTNNTLNQLRDQLRKVFKASKLQHRIDSRYTLKTAHITAIRFQEKFQQKEAFLSKLEAYRTFDFGTTSINELYFVCNDWYQKTGVVKTLSSFKLS